MIKSSMGYRQRWSILLSILLLGCSFQVTPPLLKIGVVAPFEGQYRSIGYDVLWAVKLAVGEINAAGGVAGYRVELVALNDDGDPQEASQRAQELAMDPNVLGVLGHFREETTLASLEFYHQAGLALIAPAVPALELTRPGYEEIFRLGADEVVLAHDIVEFVAATSDVRRIAIVAENHPRPVQEVAAAQGIELQGFISPQEFLNEAGNRRFDFIFFGGSDTSAADFLLALQELSNPPQMLGGENLNTPQLLVWAGEAAEGTIYATSTLVIKDPDFVAGYRALAGGDPGPWAGMAYDGAKILLRAIEEAIVAEGAPSREGVVRAMQDLEPYAGLTGNIAFDSQGNQIDPPVHIFRFEDTFPGIRLN
ncbi:MAG: branched-chain amino acid ABC transporter substrate-binding protein [Chloroflexi bacterium]|nr:branched-chain amino acid ABC transporter substrate-binding protein [Chloroflexota bacterium]